MNKFESMYPRSVEAKLDKFLPRELPFDVILNINTGYSGLVTAFGKKAGIVDSYFFRAADYHERTKAPDEPDYGEFHTNPSNVKFTINIGIKMLNMAFGKEGIPRRHRMPLLNQMVATARLEAEM